MRGIKREVELLRMYIRMHLRGIRLLHELRVGMRMVHRHLKTVVGSVRELRWNDVRALERRSFQVNILERSYRFGGRLCIVLGTKNEVGVLYLRRYLYFFAEDGPDE